MSFKAVTNSNPSRSRTSQSRERHMDATSKSRQTKRGANRSAEIELPRNQKLTSDTSPIENSRPAVTALSPRPRRPKTSKKACPNPSDLAAGIPSPGIPIAFAPRSPQPNTGESEPNNQDRFESDSSQSNGRSSADDLMSRLRILCQQIQDGNANALIKLQALLSCQTELLRRVGDLDELACRLWALLATDNFVAVPAPDCLSRGVIVETFAGPNASRIERLLAEKIATSWMRHSHIELNQMADIQSATSLAGDIRRKQQRQAMRQFHKSIVEFYDFRDQLMPVKQTRRS